VASKLAITQVKSSNGASKKQLDSLRTLGLGRIGRQVERPDDAVVRGLVARVDHLVKVGDDG
jgi:large subunit ribosomal protein L30